MIFLYTMVLVNASTINGDWYSSHANFEHVIKIRNDLCFVASTNHEETDHSYTRIKLKRLYECTNKSEPKKHKSIRYGICEESEIEKYWFSYDFRNDLLFKVGKH